MTRYPLPVVLVHYGWRLNLQPRILMTVWKKGSASKYYGVISMGGPSSCSELGMNKDGTWYLMKIGMLTGSVFPTGDDFCFQLLYGYLPMKKSRLVLADEVLVHFGSEII